MPPFGEITDGERHAIRPLGLRDAVSKDSIRSEPGRVDHVAAIPNNGIRLGISGAKGASQKFGFDVSKSSSFVGHFFAIGTIIGIRINSAWVGGVEIDEHLTRAME